MDDMGKGQRKQIRVFIASPGDLAPERKVFKDIISSLNRGYGDGAKIEFVPLGWEDVLATTGRRAQAVINRHIETCSLFVLALHRRWGQKAPDSSASSYTEEEFELALRLWKSNNGQPGRPGRPEILVFFKNVDAASLADPGRELKQVQAFRKRLEKSKTCLIRKFATEVEFGDVIDAHLRAFAEGRWDDLGDEHAQISLSPSGVSALGGPVRTKAPKRGRGGGRAKKASRRRVGDLSLVHLRQEELVLARAAVQAAREGREQDATILFARATEGTTDLSILSVAVEFFQKIGDSENAGRLVRRQAAIARDRKIAARHYMTLLPPGFFRSLYEHMLGQMLSSFPAHLAGEIQAAAEETYGGNKVEETTFENLVKYYTTAELVEMARHLSTPEGQSVAQKQPAIVRQGMAEGTIALQRALRKRNPDWKFSDEPAIVQVEAGASAVPLLGAAGLENRLIPSASSASAAPDVAGAPTAKSPVPA